MRGLAILAATLVVGASASASEVVETIPHKCERVDAKTLRIAGPVDDELRKCAESRLTDGIDTLHLSSPGGDVLTAIAIGDLIAKRPRTVVIEGPCLSACGNYFVPVADRLEIRPGGFIGLHGAVDPAKIDTFLKGERRRLVASGLTPDDIERQMQAKWAASYVLLDSDRKFFERHGVPLGWRLYQEKGARRPGKWQGVRRAGPVWSPVTGEADFMVVERPFLESCLPHIPVEGTALGEAREVGPRYLRASYALNAASTGNMVCAPISTTAAL